jgi:hypothetical protein
LAAAKSTAISTVIRRHVWLPRNDASLALAGMFYKLEWTADDALSIALES